MNSKIKKGNLFYKEFLLFALFSGFLCLCFYLVGRLFIRSAAEENAQYQQSAIKTYISFIDSKRSIELKKQAIIGYLPPEGVAVSDQDLLTYIERTARETDEELIFYDVLSSRMIAGDTRQDITPELLQTMYRRLSNAGTPSISYYLLGDTPGVLRMFMTREHLAAIMLRIGRPDFDINSIAKIGNAELYFYDSFGNIQSADAAAETSFRDAFTFDSFPDSLGSFTYSKDGKQYIVHYYYLEDSNTKIAIIVPDSQAEAIRRLNWSLAASLVSLFIVSFALAYYYSHEQYKDIEKILVSTGDYSSLNEDAIRNDLDYIQRAFTDRQETIKTQQEIIKGDLLMKRLRGLDYPSDIHFFFDDRTPYIVIAICMEAADDDADLNDRVMQAILEIIRTEKHELTFAQGKLYVVLEANGDISGRVRKLKSDIEGKTGCLLSFSCSNTMQLPDELNTAFQQVSLIEDYCLAIELYNYCIFFHELPSTAQPSQNERLEYSQLQRLSDAIVNLDAEDFEMTSNSLFAQLSVNAKKSARKAILDNNLITAVICESFISIPNLPAELRQAVLVNIVDVQNADSIRKALDLSAATLRALSSRGNDNASNSRFTAMLDYVNRNAFDPTFSAASLCSEFHLSPASVTRLFQQNLGVGFLDYLHSRRIKHAKELLTTSDEPVSSIAEKVGYSNSLTITRAFKKYVGETPGTYRMNHRS